MRSRPPHSEDNPEDKHDASARDSQESSELASVSPLPGWPGTPSRTPPSSREGEMIRHYELKKIVGRGGMGVVYDAYDTRLQRVVAIKLLHDDLLENRERHARFLREARLVAKLRHPNIVAVYEVGETEREIFIAMARLEGHSLREKIQENPQGLPVAEAIRIARDITAGVGEAHMQGVIHRDIKPENVIVCHDGTVKLLDFGLAKAFSSADEPTASATTDLATAEGMVAGTAPYMAPEQARGEPLDARADVFAIGIVLYEMLAGKRPFQGKTSFEVQAAVLRDEPAPLVTVPTTLEQVVLRCLDKRPEARFANATELAKALETPTWGPQKRSANKRLWLIVVAVACLVSLVFVWRLAAAPVTLENLPRPTFKNHPKAEYAYRSALAFMRNAKWGAAEDELGKALAAYPAIDLADLDRSLKQTPELANRRIADALKENPDIATLHARMALAKMDHFAIDQAGSIHYRIATAPTAQLSAYDRALMSALEPMFKGNKPQLQKTITNLENMTKNYGEYAELFMFLASFYRYDSADKRKDAANEAIRLDPYYADALQMKAVAEFETDNLTKALETLRICADNADATSDCMAEKARLENLQGLCLDAQQDVDVALDRVTPSPWIFKLYLHLWYQKRSDPEQFRSETSEKWTHIHGGNAAATKEPSPAEIKSYEHAKFAAAYGQFAKAKEMLEKLPKNAASNTDIEWMLTEISWEMCEFDTAADLAMHYLAQHSTDSEQLDALHLYMARIALKRKRLLPHQFAELRRETLKKWKAAASSWTPVEQAQMWAMVYVMGIDLMDDGDTDPSALYGQAADEAKEALDAIQGNSVVNALRYDYGPSYFPRLVAYSRALYSAGKREEAMIPLEQTYKRCDMSTSIFSVMRSNLLYARALEAQALVAPDDTKKNETNERACSVYQSIVDRWGHEKSITAINASKALQRLSCHPGH